MFLKKLSLVIWKNLVIRKRHWILTIIEIVIPILLFILAYIVRNEIGNTSSRLNPVTSHPIWTEKNLTRQSNMMYSSDSLMLYAPDNGFTKGLMKEVTSRLKKRDGVFGFNSEDELISYFETLNDTSQDIFAFVFENQQENGIPDNFTYKIRLSRPMVQTSLLFPEFQNSGPGYAGHNYYDSHFLTFQLLLNKAYMNFSGIPWSNYELSLQEFPYPAYRSEDYVQIFSVLLPFCTVLSFVMLCPAILKRVVEEKQTGVKELMKMMGLKSWMLWLGWMINALIVNIVSVTVIMLLIKPPFKDIAILQHSDGFLVWLILVSYCAASVAFCFAISSFFSRPTLAMSVGVILWFVSYAAPFSMVMSPGYVSPVIKALTALLPNTAISWTYRLIVAHESKNVGLTWTNVFSPPSGIRGDLSVGIVWLMLILDIILYCIVTWYVNSIMPGKYGVARPWYFVFMPSYWRSRRVDNMKFPSRDDITSNPKFENPHENLSVGIKIENLYKVFKSFGSMNKKVAVDGVTLDIYSGEITALLGHNGAGKTTTMSILTGMFSPTSGSVYIGGYDIRDNLDKVRESLGLCPQHNLLFTDLTVLEHLLFFAMLKGCSNREANEEARDLIQKLNLEEKKNQMCSTLSGGMKRKLSLGIALIGHTKVLMLDEPTSGMDPEARREIWDLLLNMRGERTILITTHFMEEADVLGDRIAIMDHGRVQCYGTSLFLKKLYGTGYQLNLLKEDGCNVPKITQTIQNTIPQAAVKGEMGSVLCYTLPSEQRSEFPLMFDVLERNKQQLAISSIGVSITTLEEVFLRVGKEAEDENDGQGISEPIVEYTKLTGSSESLTSKKKTGASLVTQQFVALFVKRILFTYRKWIAFALQAIIPIGMALLTVLLSGSTGSVSEPQRTMNLNDYGTTEVLYSFSPELQSLNHSYVNLVKSTGSNIENVPNVSASLLDAADSNIQLFRNNYIIAAELNASTVNKLNGMFSSIAVHSAPISLDMISNTILKSEKPGKIIVTINHPLKQRQATIGEGLETQVGIMMLWMTLMPFGLLFLTASFLTFPLVERVSKAKQLQFMTGASPLSYWLTCFLWDFLVYLVIAFIMVLVVLIADPLRVFSRAEELGVYLLLVIMYGASAIPFAYLFSHFRNTTAGAFALVVILNMLIGLIMSVVVYAMMMSTTYKTTGETLKYTLEFIPHFTITYAFTRFSQQVITNNKCRIKKTFCDSVLGQMDICCSPECKDGDCPPIYNSYLEIANDSNKNGVGEEVLYMGIDTVLYFILIMLVEFGVFGKLYEYIKKEILWKISSSQVQRHTLDEDVMKEEDRVDGQVKASFEQTDDDIMLVHNLMKRYTRNFMAVKGVSFGVASGECFGLLGVNGAGKTTTFKMLTGDEIPTEGDAWINQYCLSKERAKFMAQIGYCPQFDAINEALTGREMLTLFAQLRGVSQGCVDSEVNKWIVLMGLREYENRQCGTYSGGNKRKLSTAMALIGDPPIVFLDEPTSGVDPVARRNLWSVLTTIQKSGQSVVLTSHSMEECEALCNRLAIMVGGQFMCMGGIQYLKQKFGQGFTVMVKLKATGNENFIHKLKDEIERKFSSGCILKDEHQGLLHYHVTDPETPWKYLFTTMENIKAKFSLVEDYTISETTLEQVFLSFAKIQAPVYNTSLV